MNDIKIESPSITVVATGTTISFNNEPIAITYGPPEDRLKLIIEFTEDEKNKELKVDYKTTDPQTLRVICTNFDNPLGSGTLKPIEVGTISRRKLYIHFRVYPLNAISDKTIHFTFFRNNEK